MLRGWIPGFDHRRPGGDVLPGYGPYGGKNLMVTCHTIQHMHTVSHGTLIHTMHLTHLHHMVYRSPIQQREQGGQHEKAIDVTSH